MQEMSTATGYTMPEVLMFVTAATALIGAVFAGIVSVVVAFRTNAAIKDNTALTQATLTKTAVIEGHVNSEKTSDAKTIEFQQRENEMLRAQLADKDRVAGLLAQAAATVVTPPAAAVAAAPVLAQIEANTDATAQNTATTKADVKKLKADKE
jgi:hypothetical protein